LELRHLRYLVTVAEELHFGRAAIRLNISQPPLSHQIRQLEEELGVKLFERNTRGVRLTEAGSRIVQEAQQVLRQVDHFAKVAAYAGEGEIGHLPIGAVGGVNDLLMETLRVFAKRYPRVCIELQFMSTGAQVESLREGKIRVGFVSLPVLDASLASELIVKEPLCVALPKAHPLAAHHRVPLEALANERFIFFPRRVTPGLHDTITAMCRNAGVTLNVAHEVDNISASLTMVSANLGLAFCTPGLQKSCPGVAVRPLREPAPFVEYGVAFRRGDRTPVMEAFLRITRQTARRRIRRVS
jgi:DNA-binding transcriptional LysR family regulator